MDGMAQCPIVTIYQNERRGMNKKMKLAIGCLILFSITACATPGSGFLFNIILNRAQAPGALHSAADGEAADGSKWHLQLKSEGAPWLEQITRKPKFYQR
jgi:hypothetical protein